MILIKAGELTCLKVATVRDDPAGSTIKAMSELVGQGLLTEHDRQSVRHTHSSTVATNALIEKDGPTVALVTTKGFRDVLNLQRLALPNPMKFTSRRPTPLVQRRNVFGVEERTDSRGTVRQDVNVADVEAIADALGERGIDHVVVSLLHGYANGDNERRVGDILRQHLPDVRIECSHEVWPQAREYERATLCTMNAFVRPKIESYASNLIEGLTHFGIGPKPLVSRSNGGMELLETLATRPVSALLSGPAGGVTGAAVVAGQVGWAERDLMTFDVGGTSADIGAIRSSRAILSSEEHIASFPLLQPSVAVSSIGAGGGSEIWTQQDGTIKVGPKSVGSDPGPLCYGNPSATVPALSDAFLVAGILSGGQRLADRLQLDADAATAGMSDLVDDDPRTTAATAIRIAIAVMAAEAMNVLARRGIDAAEFCMVAYGGAGPMFAAMLAEEIRIHEVLIPHTPGALSAYGAALSDLQGDLIEPVYARLDQSGDVVLPDHHRTLAEGAQQWLATQTESLTVSAVTVSYSAEMRYEGQGYDVSVPVDATVLQTNDIDALREAFDVAHREAYGHSSPQMPARLNELRAHITGAVDKSLTVARQKQTADRTPVQQRPVHLYEGEYLASVYDRNSLSEGDTVAGPAVIEQMDTTTFVPPNWTLRVVQSGNMILSNEGAVK